MCRSRRELSNAYLLAKISVDTAENEPLEVWGKIFSIIHWCPYSKDNVLVAVLALLHELDAESLRCARHEMEARLAQLR